MRLTTKSSYGVRALVNLAVRYAGGKPISIKDLSRKEGISSVYLEQIFNRLKKGGIVKSVRGPRGGYILEKNPADVSVFDVVVVLEGSAYFGRHASCKGSKDKCARSGQCVSKEVWEEVARQVKSTLERFTLDDLAARAAKTDIDAQREGKQQ